MASKFNLLNILNLFLISNLFAANSPILKPSDFLDFVYEKSQLVASGEKAQIIVKFNPQNPEEFILIRTGVKDWGYNSFSKISQYSLLNNKYGACKGENLPFSNFTIRNNQIILNEKFKVLSECLSLQIEDPDGKGIQIPEEGTQTCKFQKLNENLFLASIGDCFLKPKPGQSLTITLLPNPKCLERKFLEEKNISPTEIVALMEAYTYPTPYIGQWFEAIDKLDERTTFLNINPGSEFFNLLPIEVDSSTNNKSIYRPASYLLPQMTLTSLEMQLSGRYLYVDLNLLLSTNSSKTICRSNICSIQSNFDIPLVAELFLYKIHPNGKKEEISSQIIGDRLPNRWTGELSSSFILKNVELEEGVNYTLEFSFSDPYLGYQQLKKSVKSRFSLGRGSIGSIGSMGGMGTLDGFGGGGIGGLPTLGSGNIRSGLPRMGLALKFPRLTQSLNDPTFPAEYKEICNQDLSICEKASSKEFARMMAQFKVKSLENNKVDYDKKLSISWKTNLWKDQNYELDLLNRVPKVNCDN